MIAITGVPITQIGVINADTATDGQVLTADGAGGAGWEAVPSSGPGYLVYVAKLYQSGIDAPQVTVLQNTIGTITWTRTSPGVATASKGSSFSDAKTIVFAFCRAWDGVGPFPAEVGAYDYDGSNNLKLLHFFLGGLADGYRTSIEIRIYP